MQFGCKKWGYFFESIFFGYFLIQFFTNRSTNNGTYIVTCPITIFVRISFFDWTIGKSQKWSKMTKKWGGFIRENKSHLNLDLNCLIASTVLAKTMQTIFVLSDFIFDERENFNFDRRICIT